MSSIEIVYRNNGAGAAEMGGKVVLFMRG